MIKPIPYEDKEFIPVIFLDEINFGIEFNISADEVYFIDV